MTKTSQPERVVLEPFAKELERQERVRDYRDGDCFLVDCRLTIGDLRRVVAALAATPAIKEATAAQHFDLPKGEPARFVRNGVLETCQCRDCVALAAAPAPTGIQAADTVFEYLKLCGIGDEGDAANIIHLLHRSGVKFPPLPATPAVSENEKWRSWREYGGITYGEEARKAATPADWRTVLEAIKHRLNISSDHDFRKWSEIERVVRTVVASAAPAVGGEEK